MKAIIRVSKGQRVRRAPQNRPGTVSCRTPFCASSSKDHDKRFFCHLICKFWPLASSTGRPQASGSPQFTELQGADPGGGLSRHTCHAPQHHVSVGNLFAENRGNPLTSRCLLVFLDKQLLRHQPLRMPSKWQHRRRGARRSRPPTIGPSAMGKRLTDECSVTPITCFSLGTVFETSPVVPGREIADQERKRNEPATTACLREKPLRELQYGARV
jgi:hypothetical protein